MATARRARSFILLPDWRTILASLLIVASFPPWGYYSLIWISMIPWFFALKRRDTIFQAVVQGAWLSFLMSLFGFYWVAYVLHEFANLPWPVAILCFLIYNFFGQFQFWVFAPFFMRFERITSENPKSPLALLCAMLALAFFYTGVDWLLPKLFMDTLGHCFYTARWVRQAADIGGAFLLTLAVLVVNQTLFLLITRLKQRSEPSVWPAIRATSGALIVSALCCVGLVGYGIKRSAEINALTSAAPRNVRAAVVQANVGDFDKMASEKGLKGASDSVLRLYFTLSDKALESKPQFLVWPETAYPSTFRTPMTPDDLAHDQSVETYVRQRNIPLLFGGYDHLGNKDFNTLFLLSPFNLTPVQGSDLQVYHKNILLLFGEYIPFADDFPFIKAAFPQVGNFGRGNGPEALPVHLTDGSIVKVGPVICYEALFSDFVIGAARKGSQLILNITNDSWFGPYGEPDLHLSLTTFRSLETRLPQLRATNTGISTLIMPDGEITQPTKVMTQTLLNVTIPMTEPIPTLMKSWGDWFGKWAICIGVVLLFLTAWVFRRAHGQQAG